MGVFDEQPCQQVEVSVQHNITFRGFLFECASFILLMFL